MWFEQEAKRTFSLFCSFLCVFLFELAIRVKREQEDNGVNVCMYVGVRKDDLGRVQPLGGREQRGG